jgi:hypothetical protein
MTYIDCVNACLANREFMREWDRLNNSRLSSVNSIEGQVDLACGKLDDDAAQLFRFIHEYIWLPLLENCDECREAN